ncbi:MAG: peptidylprolyl isomerase [Ktedonobacteraceae bacterium]|nr:peptidylprolyl isomerase [Ktedonobacteraceae bacterium]
MQQNTIPLEQQKFTQSQQGSESVQWLQDDLLIRNWLTTQNNTVRTKIEPSASAVEAALRDFKANLPKSTSYEKFLSNDHVTDADIHAMMALIVRRTNMQAYLSDQVHSPAYQVQARGITLDTEQHANDVLNQLRKGGDFAKLAKEKSLDSSTKDKGGDFGWLAQGQYAINYAQSLSVTVDNWLFDPARKVNELSPVLKENGTFHIVQITGINRSRAIDSATISSLKTKALDIWLLQQKALPGTKITEIDQSKMLDASNMPPNLPSAAPGTNPNTGLPDGGFPGGDGGTGGTGSTGGTNGQP